MHLDASLWYTNFMDENKEKEVLTPEEIEAEQKKKKRKSTIKYIINSLIVLILTVVALVISLGQDFEESFKILSETRIEWLLLMLIIMVGISLVRALILFCFARLYTRETEKNQRSDERKPYHHEEHDDEPIPFRLR